MLLRNEVWSGIPVPNSSEHPTGSNLPLPVLTCVNHAVDYISINLWLLIHAIYEIGQIEK